MVIRACLCLALIAAPVSVAAAPRKPAPPTAASQSLASFVAREAAARELSGTVLVRRPGHPTLIRSFGLADRSFAVPATPTTRFRIASITKLFASTIAMQMVDEGKLKLDSPIAAYLPQYPGEGADRVTVHQLLNHTSGIAQYDRIASLEQALVEGVPQYQEPMTAAATLARCCSGKLAHAPGSTFDYNNADYLVLGRIIERIDHRSFAESLSARILRPLGLVNSGIAFQSAIVPRLAPTYYWRDDRKEWMNDLPFYFENWDAAGGMYSSPADVAAFADALFGGKLITPASLARMLTPGQDDYGYGLWSYSFTRGGKTYRVAKRPGSIMGSNAVLYRLLDQGVTIVILANTNRADLDQFAQRLAERIVR